ncbi:hypothetical protein IFM89_019773 [Coptis chinensis]|uniref:Uncharacterized protein n=1 Tax=Coptis chinensis TaxID=261450 RepID=A0A835LWE6_9MAGN|nr:hypothetical protein IFM89_019773 [Coptis chinensis]
MLAMSIHSQGLELPKVIVGNGFGMKEKGEEERIPQRLGDLSSEALDYIWILKSEWLLLRRAGSGISEVERWLEIKEIGLFAGRAVGLWICGPLMSLIDTVVIGQGSSLELAALGPGTVVCDYTSYVFMFLSIATSNMVATSIAREEKHKISILLFVGFTCGVGMLLLTKVMGAQILTAFTGPKNLSIVPAANTYVQI